MKLRIILLVVWCIGLGLGLRAQETVVIHATAGCKVVATGKAIVCGQKLGVNEKLDLGNRNGQIVTWDVNDGLTLIGAQTATNGKWRTTGTCMDLELPMPRFPEYQSHFSTLVDLQAHFHARKYLLLDKSWLIVDAPFRLQKDTVLFFQFERPQADIAVSRKVERHGDSLLLAPRFILDMNGKPVPAEDARNFQLFWLDRKTNRYESVANFNFVFADEEVLVEEVTTLIKAMRAARGEQAGERGIVMHFLVAAHGAPDPHNLNVWMDAHFPETN